MQYGLPAPNDVIADKYTVMQPLGRGGMGAVYIVAHRVTGKRMALKCLLPEYLDNPDLVERFVREAQAMGRIEHRHVVDVFDVGRDRNVLFIVMELLDGKPLSDLLHDEQLTLEEALAILVRAMEGVAAAHVHGIVHRDLKPDNIFVCWGASGRLDDPRVLDFGISKLDEGVAASLTRSGVAMGTPRYMSLEQLSGHRDLDQRVDVYAMGVILYEATAGVPPHMADSVAALAIRVLTTAPTHLAELRPDLPAGLADVVMKAIARDRADRYPSMNALMDAVRPYVPRGSGLLVPEGQGRPLRTPRGAGAASTPGAARAWAAANSGLANPAVPRAAVANPGVANPGVANPGVANPGAANPGAANPGAANPGAANPAPVVARVGSAGGSPLKWAASGAAGLLLVAGALWAAITLRPGASGPASVAPSVAPSTAASSTPVAHEVHAAPAAPPLAASTAVEAGLADAETNVAQVTADAVAPLLVQEPVAPPADLEPRARSKRGRRRARERNEAPAPATSATPSPKTAQGRAGKLGSDDF